MACHPQQTRKNGSTCNLDMHKVQLDTCTCAYKEPPVCTENAEGLVMHVKGQSELKSKRAVRPCHVYVLHKPFPLKTRHPHRTLSFPIILFCTSWLQTAGAAPTGHQNKRMNSIGDHFPLFKFKTRFSTATSGLYTFSKVLAHHMCAASSTSGALHHPSAHTHTPHIGPGWPISNPFAIRT